MSEDSIYVLFKKVPQKGSDEPRQCPVGFVESEREASRWIKEGEDRGWVQIWRMP